MKSSELLINKIKEFEGCKLFAYRDSVGIPTIGVGHTKGVKMGQSITMAQAETLLKGDLLPIEKFINTIKEVNTQGEFDALVDFAFNLGLGALKKSTLLLKIIDKYPTKNIQSEFLKWDKAGGKKLRGLTLRRQAESALLVLKYEEEL